VKPNITDWQGNLYGAGQSDPLTGLLSIANKYRKYLVTGWKAWIRMQTVPAVTSTVPFWVVVIPRVNFNLTEWSALASDAARWRYLMCHPFAKKYQCGSGGQATTTEIEFYQSRNAALELDRFEDLGDEESGSHFSGTITVDDTPVGVPNIELTDPASAADTTVMSNGSTMIINDQLPMVAYSVPVTVDEGLSARYCQIRLRKYVLFYDAISPQDQAYTVSTV